MSESDVEFLDFWWCTISVWSFNAIAFVIREKKLQRRHTSDSNSCPYSSFSQAEKDETDFLYKKYQIVHGKQIGWLINFSFIETFIVLFRLFGSSWTMRVIFSNCYSCSSRHNWKLSQDCINSEALMIGTFMYRDFHNYYYSIA